MDSIAPTTRHEAETPPPPPQELEASPQEVRNLAMKMAVAETLRLILKDIKKQARLLRAKRLVP